MCYHVGWRKEMSWLISKAPFITAPFVVITLVEPQNTHHPRKKPFILIKIYIFFFYSKPPLVSLIILKLPCYLYKGSLTLTYYKFHQGYYQSKCEVVAIVCLILLLLLSQGGCIYRELKRDLSNKCAYLRSSW